MPRENLDGLVGCFLFTANFALKRIVNVFFYDKAVLNQSIRISTRRNPEYGARTRNFRKYGELPPYLAFRKNTNAICRRYRNARRTMKSIAS